MEKDNLPYALKIIEYIYNIEKYMLLLIRI